MASTSSSPMVKGLSGMMELDISNGSPALVPREGADLPGAFALLPGEDDGLGMLSSSAPGSDGVSRNSRLARKAESARQARLRHKQFVTDLQEQAAGLQQRINELEVHCTSGPGSAAVAFRELKSALTAEQQAQLRSWLVEAQGEDNVLTRYENGSAVPPPSNPAALAAAAASGLVASRTTGSAPIAIGGGATHWRGGGNGASPMESDEDATFPMSRSWDDCEVARSILNLNSPNGFHPVAMGANGMPPVTNLLSAAAAMPSSSGPPGGTSLFGTSPASGTSLLGGGSSSSSNREMPPPPPPNPPPS